VDVVSYRRAWTNGRPILFPTVTDPSTFARPWTAARHLWQSAVPDVFEYACHEGNYAMRNILSGAREAERAER
jgi:hypothetical protein